MIGLKDLLIETVDFCRRHAIAVVVPTLIATGGLGYYTATHLGVDTDTSKLISPDLPWRQREAAFDKAFPQNVDLLAVVIDGQTPDQTEDATAALAEALKPRTDLFNTVRRPDGGEFFQRNGLMLLPVEDVTGATDQMIQAQSLIGSLAADPSLRGLFSTLSLFLGGVEQGAVKLDELEAPLGQIANTSETVLTGKPVPLSWQSLLTGRKPLPQEMRRFILVQPKLDYDALEPGKKASDAIRQIATDLKLTPENGVRVRLTGPVALSDEEFGSVSNGAGLSTALAFGAVCLILFIALRSARLIGAILVTLVVGLIATAAFATVAVGSLTLISVAFAVLFVGLAVDFGIQFSVRYRAERFEIDDLGEALRRSAARVGLPLALAALATAVGFLSFLPTDYSGVSELGLIAGVGMIIALILNLTLLPALLALFRPSGEAAPVGYAWAAPIDAFLLKRRKLVIGVAVLIAIAGAAVSPKLSFDFNPLNLKDPHTESMATLYDLMSDPETTPYSLDVMTGSRQEAAALAAKIEELPEVLRAVTINTYIPQQQTEKLEALNDAATLLGPTLTPAQIAPAPTDDEILASISSCIAKLRAVALGRPADDAAVRLARDLDDIAKAGPDKLPALQGALIAGLKPRLAELRLALSARPVAYEDLPPDLVRAWVTPDGRARIEVFPKIDVRTNAGIEKFANAVRTVAPQVSGGPIAIKASADTVVGAFVQAGTLALVAIAALLWITLRSLRDVALVLIPLLLAASLTLITSVAVGLPLNFANIIALPLLLGIGVAFDIYFVMNWRAGLSGPLQSSTARAVIFSAATTTCAFGSLAASSHPGTSDMGKLLALCLFYTLVCTLFILPALLGPVKTAEKS